MEACGKRHLSIVKCLNEKGVDINIENKDGQTALYWSCVGGNVDVVSLLIDKRCDVLQLDKSGTSVLMQACGKGHLSTVELLLRKGVDINQSNNTDKRHFILPVLEVTSIYLTY